MLLRVFFKNWHIFKWPQLSKFKLESAQTFYIEQGHQHVHVSVKKIGITVTLVFHKLLIITYRRFLSIKAGLRGERRSSIAFRR